MKIENLDQILELVKEIADEDPKWSEVMAVNKDLIEESD